MKSFLARFELRSCSPVISDLGYFHERDSPRWEGEGLLTSGRQTGHNSNLSFWKPDTSSSCVCNTKSEINTRAAEADLKKKYYMWWAHSMTSVLWRNLAGHSATNWPTCGNTPTSENWHRGQGVEKTCYNTILLLLHTIREAVHSQKVTKLWTLSVLYIHFLIRLILQNTHFNEDGQFKFCII